MMQICLILRQIHTTTMNVGLWPISFVSTKPDPEPLGLCKGLSSGSNLWNRNSNCELQSAPFGYILI